jgi:membrane-bound serine protease (ClpP class)
VCAAASAATRGDENQTVIYRIPIDGVIDLGLAPFVSRVVVEAERDDAVVLLDINTFGGRVDAAVLIRDTLVDAPVKTVAFIHPRAISAGALISLACETIAITPGGTIGAATPITGGAAEEPEAADEKMMSYMRTEMRATAERRGRNPDIAEAMVDPDKVVDGISEKGKVLTLTTEEAIKTKIADHVVDDVDALLETLGLGEARVIDARLNWAETIARAVSNPMVTSLLLSLGMLGVMLELYQPGWGLPGTLGVICLGLFFFGHNVVQLAGFEEILLFVLGLGLIALELLVIPGFGFVGILGGVLALAGIVMSMIGLDFQVSWELGFVHDAVSVVSLAILITAAGGVLIVKLLPGTGLTKRFVLGHSLGTEAGFHSHETDSEGTLPVGTLGEVLSDLRPAGIARFEGRRRDVVSEGGYIDVGSTVAITAWRGGTAVVKKAHRAVDEGKA